MSFKCFRQLEYADCGMTCVRMIARHFGKDIPAQYLKKIVDCTRLGLSIQDIIDCCNKIKVEACAVRLTVDDVIRMPLPAILYWQQKHFVVFYKVDPVKRRFYIADPSIGKIRYNESEFLSYWTASSSDAGIAILAETADGFDEQLFPKNNPVKKFFEYLLSFFKGCRQSMFAILGITLFVLIADYLSPILLQRTVDDGVEMKNLGVVVTLLLSQGCVVVGSLVSSYGISLLTTYVGLNLNIKMVHNLLDRLSKFPISFFDRKVSADFVQKINDQSRIKDFLMTFPGNLLLILLNMIVFSCLLIYYSPLIFSIFISFSILEVMWSMGFLNKRKTIDLALYTYSSENRNHAFELSNGMADLKIAGGEKARIDKWKSTQQLMNKASISSSWLTTFQTGGSSVISRIKDLVVTGLGSYLVIEGELSLGALMTLGYITGRLSAPFTKISTLVSTFQDAILSYQRIEEIMEEPDEERGESIPLKSNIEIDGVWFKYAGSKSPYVIKNCNLSIREGSVTAIVGESGCGKSTLIKLMLGFYTPQKGNINFDGIPIGYVCHTEWLKKCGVVMQQGKIFTGTLIENIAMSGDLKDETKIWTVLETVGLKTYVESLPMKLHTKIGSSGIEMSGGQCQRLMIARALFKNPDILFLDEATSSLDANNEKRIVNNINTFGKGKTVVIAAHRLSTIMNADKIVYMENGEIKESGTHRELLELNGKYRQLVRNQMAGDLS